MPEVGELHGLKGLASLGPFSGALTSSRCRIKILEYSCCCLSWLCLFRKVLGRQLLDVLRPRWLSEGFRSVPSCGRDWWQPVHGGFWQNLTHFLWWHVSGNLRRTVICAHSILQLQYLPVVCLLEKRRFETCTQSMLQLLWYVSGNCGEWRSENI